MTLTHTTVGSDGPRVRCVPRPLPLKVLLQIWQKWGRPSWCRLATCLSSGPFSVKRCSQNSQPKGRSPVWVRLCLSRLAATRRGERGELRVGASGMGHARRSRCAPGW